eukprot:s1385_g22.t1
MKLACYVVCAKSASLVGACDEAEGGSSWLRAFQRQGCSTALSALLPFSKNRQHQVLIDPPFPSILISVSRFNDLFSIPESHADVPPSLACCDRK